MSPTWSERVAATRPVSPANLLCFHAWQFERAALQHIAVPLSLLVGCVLLALTSESAEQARMCATDACGALVGVLVRLRLRAHPEWGPLFSNEDAAPTGPHDYVAKFKVLRMPPPSATNKVIV